MFGFGKKEKIDAPRAPIPLPPTPFKPWVELNRNKYIGVDIKSVDDIASDGVLWFEFSGLVAACGVDEQELLTRARKTGDMTREERQIIKYAQSELSLGLKKRATA